MSRGKDSSSVSRKREGQLDLRRLRQAEFALYLHERGWSQERITRELACSKSTVVAMLRYARGERTAAA